MSVQSLIKKLETEIAQQKKEVANAEGLFRLQEKLQDYNGEDKLIWSDELLKKIQERPTVSMHMVGVPELDALIGGFREQQLITISAHSKHGKTAFGLFLMEKMESLNPVMIPMEQSNEEIVEQRYANGYTIPRFLSPENLAIRRTTDWIEERIVEGIAKYNTKLVLIDHLGYIDDFGGENRYKHENLAYRLQLVMQELKMIAKNWNVIILLLVHIAQGDETKTPQNEDIKGSSGILQESDKVIFLWRKNYKQGKIHKYENETLVYVTANRRTGKNGIIGMKFNQDNGQYEIDTETNDWVKSMVDAAELAALLDSSV